MRCKGLIISVALAFGFRSLEIRCSAQTPKVSNAAVSTVAPKTLGAFKRKFLNMKIVVSDVPFSNQYCLEWISAIRQSDGTLSEAENISNHLPITYNGRTATVIAIQLAPSSLQKTQVGGANAFGEMASEDDIDDPYMVVFVRFEDGILGSVRGFPITLVPQNMELASGRDAVEAQVQAILGNAIGHNLYAVGYSRLYKPTATVEEISGSQEILARLSTSEVPKLEPLLISKAKYVAEKRAIIFKARMPSGSEAIAYTPSEFIGTDGEKLDSLSQVTGLLLTAIPSGLTSRELKAIKDMSVFRGMSSDALDYTLGFKESENDWGKGGKQRIYFGGKLIVYLNSLGKVEDWQQFD